MIKCRGNTNLVREHGHSSNLALEGGRKDNDE